MKKLARRLTDLKVINTALKARIIHSKPSDGHVHSSSDKCSEKTSCSKKKYQFRKDPTERRALKPKYEGNLEESLG